MDAGSCVGASADEQTLFDGSNHDPGHVPRKARRAAHEFCRDCPVLDACRAYAVGARGDTLPLIGVWGGLYLARGATALGRLTAHDLLGPVVVEVALAPRAAVPDEAAA